MIKKSISKGELQEIYDGNTVNDAAKILGVSLKTFYRMLERAGIELKRPTNEHVTYKITG